MGDCKSGWHIGLPIDNHIVDIPRFFWLQSTTAIVTQEPVWRADVAIFGRFTGMTSGPDFQMNAVIGTIVRVVPVMPTDLFQLILMVQG